MEPNDSQETDPPGGERPGPEPDGLERPGSSERPRSSERHESDPDPGPRAPDALRRLEERLDRASSAAERLIAEAAASAAARAARTPPPAGWQSPSEPGDGRSGSGEGDLALLSQVLQSVRELIPPELQQRLAEALREVLLAVRALIDWYLERVQQRQAAPVEVRDIPIL
jgi:hypothetical protein